MRDDIISSYLSFRFVLFCTVHTHAHARTHSHTPHVADDGVFTVPLNPQYSRKCDSLRGDVCGIYACARVLSARAHTYADNVHCTLDICVHSITTTKQQQQQHISVSLS